MSSSALDTVERHDNLFISSQGMGKEQLVTEIRAAVNAVARVPSPRRVAEISLAIEMFIPAVLRA